MPEYSYTSQNWPDYHTGESLEWCITNGIGGYGSGSLIASLSRSCHGYLTAQLSDDHTGYVVLEQITERIMSEGVTYDLETSSHLDGGQVIYKNGFKHLTDVFYNGTIQFKYECGPIIMTKAIALKRKENTVAIAYNFVNGSNHNATVTLTPLFNFRKCNTVTDTKLPKFRMLKTGDTISLVPRCNPSVRIDFSVSEGIYVDRPGKIDCNSQLNYEVNQGKTGLCSHYAPYNINFEIPPNSEMSYSVVCSAIHSKRVEGDALLQQASDMYIGPRSAHKIVHDSERHFGKVITRSGYDDDYASQMSLMSDMLIYKSGRPLRASILSGLPNSRITARDALIAYTGITLCNKRYKDAGQILADYASRIGNGLIHDRLNDTGDSKSQISAEAPLWFCIDAYNYVQYLNNDTAVSDSELEDAVTFIHNDIFPKMIEIEGAYEHGTDCSIFTEKNGLLHAGTAAREVSWMNAHKHNIPVTPRHGCTVELCALWYNTLCVMKYFCDIFHYDGSHYAMLADNVKASFSKSFWNPDKRCLYDVVDFNHVTGEITEVDSSIRPNQIFAVSLPFPLLSLREASAVVETVSRKLYTGLGLRTLAPDNPAYLGDCSISDDEYNIDNYNGSSWTFYMGAYISAYRKVHGPSPETTDELRRIITPILSHFSESGIIGGISASFSGNAPHNCIGSFMHAPAVGELLRAYSEDILKVR